MKRQSVFKAVVCALTAALATLAFTIENLFPPLILPGARIGVSNIFILFSAVVLGVKYAFITLIIKTVLGSLFAGNPFAILYSLPAGAVALAVELIIIYKIKNTSVVCASVAGAVLNTTAQNLIFCLVASATEYLVYLPYLALIGVISGITVGFTVYLIIRYMPSKYFVEEFVEEKTKKEED